LFVLVVYFVSFLQYIYAEMESGISNIWKYWWFLCSRWV